MLPSLPDRIIAEARSWIDTPFGHQKMTKGVRCDCAGLIRGVVEIVTGEHYEDLWDYTHRPDARYLIRMLNKYFTRIHTPAGERLADQTQPGDILLFKIDNNPQHLAIKTDKGMVHSYAQGPRKVEEVSFADPWPKRLVGVWRIAEGNKPTLRELAEEFCAHPTSDRQDPAGAGLLLLEKEESSGE